MEVIHGPRRLRPLAHGGADRPAVPGGRAGLARSPHPRYGADAIPATPEIYHSYTGEFCQFIVTIRVIPAGI